MKFTVWKLAPNTELEIHHLQIEKGVGSTVKQKLIKMMYSA